MVQFQSHVHKSRRRRDQLGRLLSLSSHQLEVREAFYQFLKQLNQRGPNALHRNGKFHAQDARVISPEYLAGFIDAEGSLMLAKAKTVLRWNPVYTAKVYIDNTDKRILEDIQRSYGGTLTTQPSRKPLWKPSYKLVWTGGRVERILSSILPFLQIKHSRARILLQFINHKKETKQRRVGMGFAALPAKVLGYREYLYRQMGTLNAKGVVSGQSQSSPEPESGVMDPGLG